jgi:tetratricopeptide (TPR) repeat protein/transcriptional regulator with XRE-family HTH domain
VFGEMVRGHRRRLSLTQEELAERSGISVRGIRNLEAGRIHAPRAGTLRVLAEALELVGAERERLLSLIPDATSPAAVPGGGEGAARFSLPPDTAAFTGRTAELAAITAAVTQAARRGGVVAIHAIDGMPGIGKTTLAVHAAHQLADRYPDGQMFVDLHAHTTGLPPTDPADALADLLRADGVDPRQLPDSLDARAALWRHRMTGRWALLVLDNVSSTAQVAALLPGSDTVLVLVTSRRRLGDLRHAAHLRLKVLPHSDAAAMFVRLAPRAADEPDAVAELVRMCDYLPLAIAIIASRYDAHDTWTMTDLLTEFRNRRERLLTVKSENATVHAAFDLSCQHLPPQRQRFFRLLGLTPGVDIDGYAAAALTGTDLDGAAEHLDELFNDHLLDETAPRRYRMHDLVRAYTHTLATRSEPDHVRERAVARLLDYYQHTAHHADTLIAIYTRPDTTGVAAPAVAPDLPDEDHALAWLHTERPNLEACLRHATAGHQHHRTVGLVAGLATVLFRDGPWTQAADLHENAAYAAARTGDKVGHAGALYDLGRVRRLVGDYPASENLLHQALTIHIEIGNRHGQADTLTEMGVVRLLVGDYPAGENLLHRALTIHIEIGNQRGQARTLYELGDVRQVAGDYPAADHLLHQALSIYTELGYRSDQAITLQLLGVVRRLVGDYPGADKLLHQALSIHTELGYRVGRATTLHLLGVVRRVVGDYAAADHLLRQALTIHTETGYRFGQAFTLHHLGVVRRLVGDYPGADKLLHQALTTYTETGNQLGQAVTRIQLAVVRYLTDDHTHAEDLLQQALTALRDIGARDHEAEALNHLGTLRRLTGHPDQAHTYHTEALTLARRIQHRVEEAHALEGLGRAAIDLADPAAITHLRQALHLYQQLGVPEADNVAATLTDLDPAPDKHDNQSPCGQE